MKKNIFEKDEKGLYILVPENIDRLYFRGIATDENDLVDGSFFLSWMFLFDGPDLQKELSEKRIIERKSMTWSIKQVKGRLLDFSKRYLQKHNSKLTNEDTKENLLAIVDEYEKAIEYSCLHAHIGKEEFDESVLELVSEKRKMIASLTGDSNDLRHFVNSNTDLIMFILKNKNYDQTITNFEGKNSKEKNFKFHYDFMRKDLSKEQIDEIRDKLLSYKKKYKLSNAELISEFINYYELESTKRKVGKCKDLIELISKREEEYKVDLEKEAKEKKDKNKQAEDAKKQAELEKERRRMEAEKEKQKRLFEKYTNFEQNGTYGPKERVIPIALNFIGARGKTIVETIGEEKVKELFDAVKSVPLRQNERVAIIIFTECSKEEALRILTEFRESAKKHGVEERVVEGVTTEFGEELLFDENNSRTLLPKSAVKESLDFIRAYNLEKQPKLIELNLDRSYLTYSLEGYEGNEKELKKMNKDFEQCIGIIHYLRDEENNIVYGIPREKMPGKTRRRVARFLDLKYKIDKKILDAFRESKKLADYEIDQDDTEYGEQ